MKRGPVPEDTDPLSCSSLHPKMGAENCVVTVYQFSRLSSPYIVTAFRIA